jgi:hypothetical protein
VTSNLGSHTSDFIVAAAIPSKQCVQAGRYNSRKSCQTVKLVLCTEDVQCSLAREEAAICSVLLLGVASRASRVKEVDSRAYPG